jgi:hypothetical protein
MSIATSSTVTTKNAKSLGGIKNSPRLRATGLKQDEAWVRNEL